MTRVTALQTARGSRPSAWHHRELDKALASFSKTRQACQRSMVGICLWASYLRIAGVLGLLTRQVAWDVADSRLGWQVLPQILISRSQVPKVNQANQAQAGALAWTSTALLRQAAQVLRPARLQAVPCSSLQPCFRSQDDESFCLHKTPPARRRAETTTWRTSQQLMMQHEFGTFADT